MVIELRFFGINHHLFEQVHPFRPKQKMHAIVDEFEGGVSDEERHLVVVLEVLEQLRQEWVLGQVLVGVEDDFTVHGAADVHPVVRFDHVLDHVFALRLFDVRILEVVHGVDCQTVGSLAEQIVQWFHV